jgi:hypothetical protein
VGPYFGSWSTSDTDLDVFMNVKLPSQVTSALKDFVQEHSKIAAKYKKPLFAYEAGQHLTGDNVLPINVRGRLGFGGLRFGVGVGIRQDSTSLETMYCP